MQFIQDGKGDLHNTFGPEDVFDYMYAVLHSPTYRVRYADFLKIDFPRLPLTSNADLFRELCKLGDRLVGLHLMEKFGEGMPKYPIKGNDVVEKIEYLEPRDRRCKDEFTSIGTSILRVCRRRCGISMLAATRCHKWLKDRKGRTFDV